MVNPLSRLGILPDKNDYRGWEYYDASLRAVLQDMNEYGTTPFNLIPNPGFESSMAFWYSVQGLNTVVTDSSSAHTGNKYLKMTAGAASVVGAGIQDSTAARYLEAMPNGVYLLSTYSYLETAASTFVARIEFFDKDKASISVSSSTNSTVGSWQAKTLTATAPANTKYLQVQLYSACASSFVTRVDDISLTMVSDSIYTLIPVSDLDTAHFLRGDYTWVEPPDHADFAGSAHGLVPSSAGGTANFLRADGNWGAPTVIKSIQRGTITISGSNTSNTATITSVTTSKTMLNWLGQTADGDIGLRNMVQLVLTDATTVTATRNYNSGTTVVSYEVIEFN